MNPHIVKQFRERLENLSISDYQGLKSPGLTCYLNSVLQVLFMTEEFREAVTRESSEILETIDPHLRELFRTLEGNLAKTHNITKQLDIKDVYEQRDAAEYLEKILCQTSPEASKIFKGELNHKTTCLGCNQTNSSKNFFWVLPLSMGDSKSRSYSVLEGWQSFFKVQRVSGDNQMFCSGCNQKQDADIEYEMTHCPDVLTLLLKRFSFNYQRNCYVKLQCSAVVPQTLETKGCRYELYAIVDHYGDLMGGHYTADIKSFETGNWYQFNDSTVKCVNTLYVNCGRNKISSTTAYLLMYKRASGRAKKSAGDALEAHWPPADEPGVRWNEAEQRQDLVFEELLRTEKTKTGVQHLNGDVIREDVFKKKRSRSFRGNDLPNGRATPMKPQESMWLQCIDNDTKDAKVQIRNNNTETFSDWTFDQSSVPPVGVNGDKQGYKNTKTLYNPRERIQSAGIIDVFNHWEGPAMEAPQRTGLTVTKKTPRNDERNYITKSPVVYPPASSHTRSSGSFRTAAEPSSHFNIPRTENPSSPRKKNESKKPWK